MGNARCGRGERSFTPAEYRSFFPAGRVESISIDPFYVLVPPKTPRKLISYVIQVSEFGQKVPGVRWISQSLLIAGRKIG